MSDMQSRFTKGAKAMKYLTQALQDQELLRGNYTIATKLAKIAKIKKIKTGGILIEQGASDNDIYFVLHGCMKIVLHNFWQIRDRKAGTHVGEMALLAPNKSRSASVIAKEDSIVARVNEPEFAKIAQGHPELWRNIASTLAERLRERGEMLLAPNEKPHLFLGSASSRGAIKVMEAIQSGLSHENIEVIKWTDDVFKPGATTIEDLFEMLDRADAAVVVATAEDLVFKSATGSVPKKGEHGSKAIRDNVIFELGLFMGRLGRKRAFYVRPRKMKPVIPTDLLGVTCLDYDEEGLSDSNYASRLGAVCSKIKAVLSEVGQMNRLKVA